jgi:hypothetical protein
MTTLPAHLTPELTLPFSATVTNHGTADADVVRISFLSSSGPFVNVQNTQSVGTCEGYGTQYLTCLYYSGVPLPPGASWTVSGEIKFPDTVGTATVGAFATSAGSEPTTDPHPNSVIQDVSMDTTTPVSLTPYGWTVPQDGLQVGTPFSWYTTVYTDYIPVSGLQVTMTIPAGLQITGASMAWTEMDSFNVESRTGTCGVAGQVVTCDAGATVGGHYPSDWVYVWVDVTPTASGTFTTTHTVSSPHPEASPDPTPDTITSSATVAPA